MEKFFTIQDAIIKLHESLKKYSSYSSSTKISKINELTKLKEELKEILVTKKFGSGIKADLVKRYRHIRGLVNESIIKLKGNELEESIIENLFSESEVIQEEQGNLENKEEDDEYEQQSSEFEEETENRDNIENMAPKLDLGTALKLVDKFTGDAEKLSSFFETIDLLRDYSEGVPDTDLLKFIKTRLVGPAHGVINSATTIVGAKKLLKDKFAIKFSPQAIEAEMASLKQNKKTISEFGMEMNELAAKLAAAHVSQETFVDEAAASAIVQPIAVKLFTNGLKDHKTQFFIKARNPTTLTKAISDALEVSTGEETVMWGLTGPTNFQRPYHNNHRGNWRGRGRGNFRGRNNYYSNRGRGYRNQQQQQNNSNHGNNQYSQQRGGHSNRRGQGHANVAVPSPQTPPQRQEQAEENAANLIDLFRE